MLHIKILSVIIAYTLYVRVQTLCADAIEVVEDVTNREIMANKSNIVFQS
jgi:hypothetical protein